MEYKNIDFVLKVRDTSPEVEAVVRKYDAFLDAITTEKFAHVREAIREGVRFLISSRYPTIDVLAREHYENSEKMRAKYPDVEAYLTKFPLSGRKAASIDLATGTGKSWVIYGIAQIMLAEGLVDKVLVLCPSLTIESGLKEKFLELSGRADVARILQELGSLHPTPEIKSANDPILAGDICVENIHAVYERTGSSIRDSFLGKGDRTLVISDEAHHIYSSGEDAGTRKWKKFIKNEEYGFAYHIGLTGTPYIRNDDNDYFHDVIYRYGLKQAMEEGIIKTLDYVTETTIDFHINNDDPQYQIAYQTHERLKETYFETGILKPITIVVTATIFECIKEWRKIVDHIVETENISFDIAKERVIWVTSGLPSDAEEALAVLGLGEGVSADSVRKDNLQNLKLVDDIDNPVEYIVSVAMLTEGWDVKNVFQIVPHSNRAFESKLLIAQVLGRGLRIPNALTPPVRVVVNNHDRWTEPIGNLYKEILEIENRISWGYDEQKRIFIFPLHNLEYEEVQYTEESKISRARSPIVSSLENQAEIQQHTVNYIHGGPVQFDVTIAGNVPIEEAARQIKLFLKEKDEDLSAKWSVAKIERLIRETLRRLLRRDFDYLSAENLSRFKQAFGPMFRELGKKVPRMKLKPSALNMVNVAEMVRQTFSEDAVKTTGVLFYPDSYLSNLSNEERAVIKPYIDARGAMDPATALPETQWRIDHFHPVESSHYRSPLSAIYVTSGPEVKFVKALLNEYDTFTSLLKSPDKGFYSIPYSFKPTEIGSTHVKRAGFNPDFFLLKKDSKDILVVEIKQDDDLAQENKAKLRDAKEHFESLNAELEKVGEDWRYYFYFLSPTDYVSFMAAVRDGSYKTYQSELMMGLSM